MKERSREITELLRDTDGDVREKAEKAYATGLRDGYRAGYQMGYRAGKSERPIRQKEDK
ncbi:MAG: hypothetical protein IJ083_08340 [Clostridia bacterium]|nr:hypothetical protein [Clostridia bacterium]